MRQQPNYIPALTGIRAIAAWMVFFHHFNPFPKDTFLFDLARGMHIGVTLFFVLSGFLIAYRYFGEKINFRNYLVNRWARIYPLWLLLTLITFIVNPSDNSTLFSNLTLTKGFFSDLKFSGIAQGWSLTVEETFYFSALLFFPLIDRHKAFLFFLPAALLGIGVCLVGLSTSYKGFFDPLGFMINYTFFGRCTEFFVGIGLALLIRKGFRWRTTYLGLGVIALCLWSLIFYGSTDPTKGENGLIQWQGMIVNNLFLPIVGIAPLFMGLLSEPTPVSRFLSTKAMVLLGKSSYVFYLIHMGIFEQTFRKVLNNHWTIFIALNLLSIGLFLLVEEPMNTFLRRKLSVRRKIEQTEATVSLVKLIIARKTPHKKINI